MKPEIKQRIEQIKNGIVPEGYKKTKAGIVPVEWSINKAKEIFINVTDKDHNGEMQVLSATQDKGVIPRDMLDIDIKYDKNSVSGYKRVRKGNFVISLRSFQGGIEYSEYDGLVSPAYTVLTENKPICHYFYKTYLKTDDYIKRLAVATYGIRDGKQIGYDDFGFIQIPYPPLHEQEKIAKILQTQDKVIELKEKLLEEKKRQKKYLMQQLLTGKKRLPGFSGEWNKTKLGALCTIRTGKLDANAMNPNGKYRFYTCAEEIYKIDNYAFDTEALIISGNGANVGYIHYYKGKFNAYQRTYVLDRFSENIFYIMYTLELFLYIRINREKNAGNTPYIKLSALYDMIINIPNSEEQKEISNILTKADEEINLLQKDIEQEKQRKKALMQLLLTGIVRVKI